MGDVPNPWGGLVAPSGPVAPPAAPVAVAPPVAPPCPPLASSGDVLMQPKTIQDARSDGAITGTMISAPLAPAMGPITIVPAVVRATADAPAKEPMVVLTVKAFWDSPTVIKARRILIGCATIGVGAAGTILKASLDAGTNVWQLPWGAAGTAFVSATVAAALTVFFVWQKLTDNNPVQK